jgi:predicted ATPase/DNA-binding winged helix-turn-helix (wHTH) protein
VASVFEIGPFRLDADARVLTRDGLPTALGPRAVAVLHVLVEHSNEYVPKRQIIDAAWPGVVVEDGNLNVQIAAIRRVLKEVDGERWIETLARRGYRFLGPVKALSASAPRQEPVVARSNLPAAATTFVGRERDLVEIKRLLRSKRLVTIVGAGGIGKTRLALQVAAEVVDAYRDGVLLTELAALREGSLVAPALAQTLGVQEESGVPLADSLRAHLKPRQILLLLDNCEHLLEASAQVAATVVRAGGDVTLIATSREPLGIDGEQVYPLQPLSLPAEGASLETIHRSEAVQLLVERVQRQLPDFELTSSRAPAVVELCLHLDGIPLALELAAARARTLSLEQIAARLGDRFRLLASGSRTALPRQQTLRAALDWSYDLLREDERAVLRRLSIFPGSFTLDAAGAVANDGSLDEFAVVDIVSQLVSRSLVSAEAPAGNRRYRMLETTRAYALEKLAETGETASCQRRHADFFRAFFEHAPDDWLRMATPAWSAVYVPEMPNVRAALDWSLGDDGDASIAIPLASGSGVLWTSMGSPTEARQWLRGALTLVDSAAPTLHEARLLLWWSRVAGEAGAPVAELTRAVGIYRAIGDAVGHGLALAVLGRVTAALGRYDEAEALLLEARGLLENAGPRRTLSTFHFHYAALKSMRNDLAGAREHYERSLAIDRETGDEYWSHVTLGNLANVTWRQGDLEGATNAYRAQIAHYREAPIVNRSLLGMALLNLAAILIEAGQHAEALALAKEGLPHLRIDGSDWTHLDHLALRAASLGRFAVAARIVGFSDAAWRNSAFTRAAMSGRARERLDAILRANVGAPQLDALLDEGARLAPDEAFRLALEQ